MQPAKLNRTIRFKFGMALRKGTKVLIAETKENTCLIRIPSEPTLEYLVMKDALTINTMTKKEFNETASVHVYGRGFNKKIAVFFDWLQMPGVGGYKYMFVYQGHTKKEVMDEVYKRIFRPTEQIYFYPTKEKIANTDAERFKVPLVM